MESLFLYNLTLCVVAAATGSWNHKKERKRNEIFNFLVEWTNEWKTE